MFRLNWFSPLPPEQTDIAHYTARIAPALMRHFDVVFWTDLRSDPAQLPANAVVRRFDPDRLHGRDLVAEMLSRINVYHFGNDARFHGGIYRAARRFPGVAVLHDTRLHHFMFELYRPDRWSGYLELARSLYGAEGLARARSIVAADGQSIDQAVVDMPFLEAVTDRAAAVICHSEEACRDVISLTSVPTAILPLPFASLSGLEAVPRPWQAPWRFVMFGYVNPNRRLESVLRALGKLRTEVDFRFDVFGTLWDHDQIERLIADCGLDDRVTIHGFVSERQLDAAIAQAHLAFNLRHPTMGEASGGILRSWALGTPALVTDAGWYATLPQDIALRIPAENDVQGIMDAVRTLVSAPDRFREMGEAARQHVLRHHTPEVYAQQLKRVLADVPRAMTRLAARQLLERISLQCQSKAVRATMLSRATQMIPQLLGRSEASDT
jgi:glycosyltransferase involved in cell wall biosynthesis